MLGEVVLEGRVGGRMRGEGWGGGLLEGGGQGGRGQDGGMGREWWEVCGERCEMWVGGTW